MKLLDSQGRLFGKISILDLGAALVILLVLLGIFVFPGTNPNSSAQVGNTAPTKTINVEAIALGLKGREPEKFLKEGESTNLIVRNQPYGKVTLKSVKVLTRMLAVPQPNGSVKALPDPREEEAFSRNMLLILEGKGQVTDDGPVLGNQKIKIGNTLELEGTNYDFNVSVIDVKVLD